MKDSLLDRKHLLHKASEVLLKRGSPRLQMSLMVLITGLSGFVASFLMLISGIKLMWLRYPLAVLVAYAVFLFLICCWLRLYRKKLNVDLDLIALPTDMIAGEPAGLPTFNSGGGGEFGGGGASGSFEANPPVTHGPALSKSTGIADRLDLPFDADELILIAVVLGVSLLTIVVAIMMVVSAPTLLGEVLIDSLLAAGFYRRLKKIEGGNWLKSAFNRTWLPVFGLIIFFVVAGLIFHWYAPGADSIGDIWIYFKSNF